MRLCLTLVKTLNLSDFQPNLINIEKYDLFQVLVSVRLKVLCACSFLAKGERKPAAGAD